MQAGRFTIQAYDGGPEHEFFNRMPYSRRAEIELQGDPEYKKLSKYTKNGILTIGCCILAARKDGLAGEVNLPDELTVASCDAFSEEYAIELSYVEIPKKRGGGSEAVEGGADENPTVTPRATS